MAVWYLIIFILGIISGVVLNICIYRIPRGQPMLSALSYCTSCGARLKMFTIIPADTNIFNKVKCSCCAKEFNPRPITVKLLAGIIFVALFYKYQFSIQFVETVFLASILIIVFFVDIEHRIIPNSLVIFATAGGIIFYIMGLILPVSISGDGDWWSPLAGALLGSSFFFMTGSVGSLIYKKAEVIGGGDIKILFPVGLFLGWRLMLVGLFISIVLAGAICLILILLKRLKSTDTVAFGPFISIGVMISIFVGWQLMDFYFL